jgi:hypothetical protein
MLVVAIRFSFGLVSRRLWLVELSGITWDVESERTILSCAVLFLFVVEDIIYTNPRVDCMYVTCQRYSLTNFWSLPWTLSNYIIG